MTVTCRSWSNADEGIAEGRSLASHHDGMNARVDRLERVVDRINDDVTTIKMSIAKIETRMESVATKTWVMAGAIAVLVTILSAFAWIAQQYLAPILAALGTR